MVGLGAGVSQPFAVLLPLLCLGSPRFSSGPLLGLRAAQALAEIERADVETEPGHISLPFIRLPGRPGVSQLRWGLRM
jgi:hypothetical protein